MSCWAQTALAQPALNQLCTPTVEPPGQTQPFAPPERMLPHSTNRKSKRTGRNEISLKKPPLTSLSGLLHSTLHPFRYYS